MYSNIPSNWYYSIWSARRIIAQGGAIILIALQMICTVLEEFYYITVNPQIMDGKARIIQVTASKPT
jgi:hypothetical protein